MSGVNTPTGGNPFSNDSYVNVEKSVLTAKKELEEFEKMDKMSELDMIRYNMAASKYSTMVSLASGLVKNLSDTEKQVANKM